MSKPVLCPIHPDLVEKLRQPGGVTSKRPVRMWLDDNNVINVQELTDTDELIAHLYGEADG